MRNCEEVLHARLLKKQASFLVRLETLFSDLNHATWMFNVSHSTLNLCLELNAKYSKP